MRFVVLLFGIVAVILTGFMGGIFLTVDVVSMIRDQRVDVLNKLADALEQYKLAEFSDTGIFLLVAALYGLLGTVLAFARCGWQGALLLIVPVLGAAIMHPATLSFTAFQLLAALMAVFVFPLPLNASEIEEKSDEDDDDEEKPKPMAKSKVKAKAEDDDDEEEKPRPVAKSKGKAKTEEDDDDEEEKPRPKAKAKSKPKVDDDDED